MVIVSDKKVNLYT